MNALNGVVLCGGRSVRMKTDKSQLDYYGVPQWKYIYNMLSVVCSNVYISCNSAQLNNFSGAKLIVDDAAFYGAGPMTGVLSALQALDDAILVAGCDYPFLSVDELKRLIKGRNPAAGVTAAYNTASDLYEPMICIYEISAALSLYDEFKTGRKSLQQFLRAADAPKVILDSAAFENVNLTEEFAAAKQIINN